MYKADFNEEDDKKLIKKVNPENILVKILLNLIFCIVLFSVCYVNKDSDSFTYHNYLKAMFSSYNDVIKIKLIKILKFTYCY